MARDGKDKLSEEEKGRMVLAFSMGLTNAQVSAIFGICPKTLDNYRNADEDLKIQILEAKRICDFEVEESLFKRAKGFSKTIIKDINVNDGIGHGSHLETGSEEKYFPPDSSSIKFWLSNRNPARWKNTQEVNLNGLEEWSMEKLEKAAKEILEGKENEEVAD